jgi:hypothetical protein
MDQNFIRQCQFYDIHDFQLQKQLFKIKKNLTISNMPTFEQDFDIYLMLICFPEVFYANNSYNLIRF